MENVNCWARFELFSEEIATCAGINKKSLAETPQRQNVKGLRYRPRTLSNSRGDLPIRMEVFFEIIEIGSATYFFFVRLVLELLSWDGDLVIELNGAFAWRGSEEYWF